MKTKIVAIIVLTLSFLRIAQLEAELAQLKKKDSRPRQELTIPQIKEYSL